MTNANETTTLPLHPDNDDDDDDDSRTNQDEWQQDSTTSHRGPILLHGQTNWPEYDPETLPELFHWITTGGGVVSPPNHEEEEDHCRHADGTKMTPSSSEQLVDAIRGRTTHSYRLLMEIMYQYYYYKKGGDDDSTTTTTIHTDQSITVVPTLASFLYRLTLVYFEIRQKSRDEATNTNHGDTDPSSSSSPPPVWNAYFLRLLRTNPPPSMVEWKHWVRRYAPMIPIMVSTVVSHFYDGTTRAAPRAVSSSEPPDTSVCLWRSDPTNRPSWMNNMTTATTRSSSNIIPMQLTIMGLGGGVWRSIFQTSIHGASFTTLTHSLLSYYGPTVLVMETTQNEIFGYYTTVPWKVSNRWYTQNNNNNSIRHNDDDDDNVDEDADDESFLFRLHPHWNVYRPQMESTTIPKRFHQYLNPPSRQNSHTLVGLAVGGVADNVPRLHITPSFEQCKACIWDSVFDTGPLLSNDDESYFDIFSLEVWAVTKCQYQSGGADCKYDADTYEQGKRMGADRTSTMEHARQRYAKVDRAQFVDDFMNDAVLPNKLFQHRVQTRGRADFVVASDNANDGYVVDGKQPSRR